MEVVGRVVIGALAGVEEKEVLAEDDAVDIELAPNESKKSSGDVMEVGAVTEETEVFETVVLIGVKDVERIVEEEDDDCFVGVLSHDERDDEVNDDDDDDEEEEEEEDEEVKLSLPSA